MLHPGTERAAAQIDEYRLVRPLGSGTDVFLAHDRTLDRAVVLRFLPQDVNEARSLLEGARALARVSHPNLASVYRVREGGTRPCVVQSFERGERLDSVATPMTADRVLDLGRALAAALAALHAAGVAHGEVGTDRVMIAGSGAPRLFGLRGARAVASAEGLAEDVAALHALLEAVADNDLRGSLQRLAGARSKSLAADELLRGLERLARPALVQPTDIANPYRGLRAFEGEHAPLFFGRQSEVAEVLVRLRTEPWLVVAGPSGAGKSSLVRAGVVPAVASGALGERSRWDVATIVPGPRPLAALAAALAPLFERRADDLEAGLRTDPAAAP
jgi:eukaryotic-like serine/threonine-protein kinase